MPRPSPYAHRFDLEDGGCAVFHALSLDVVYCGPQVRALFPPLESRPRPFPDPEGPDPEGPDPEGPDPEGPDPEGPDPEGGSGDEPPDPAAPTRPTDPARWLAQAPDDPDRQRAVEVLSRLGMLQEPGDPHDERWLDRLREMTHHNPARMLMLVPTRRCNFDCVYCHQHEQSRGADTRMSIEQADRYLRAWAPHARRSPGKKDLLLYGGEPLLHPELVRHVIEHFHREPPETYGGEVSVILVTNGSLVTASWARFLAEHDTFVIVSCDAMQELNDRVRRTRDGKGTWHLVDRGWQHLRRAGVRSAISVTVTRTNAPEIEREFMAVIDHFQPLDIGLNSCLHPPPDAPVNEYACPPLEGTRRMLAAYARAREQGVYVEQFNRRIRPFALRLHRVKDCSSCGGRLVAQADDRWSFCDSFSFTDRYCYPFEGTFPLSTHPDYPTWCNLSPVNWSPCHACPCVALCGGGCRYDAYQASGRIDGLDPHRCTQDREILRWIIDDLARIVEASSLQGAAVRIPSEAARKRLLGTLTLDPLTIPLGNANRYGEEVGRGGT